MMSANYGRAFRTRGNYLSITYIFLIVGLFVLPNVISCASALREEYDVDLTVEPLFSEPYNGQVEIFIATITNNDVDFEIVASSDLIVVLYVDGVQIDENLSNVDIDYDESYTMNLSWVAEGDEHEYDVLLFYDGSPIAEWHDTISVGLYPTDLRINWCLQDSPLVGYSCSLAVEIENYGLNMSRSCRMAIVIDGEELENVSISAIEQNETASYEFEWLPEVMGSSWINISVDTTHRFNEPNETDNYLNDTVDVGLYRFKWSHKDYHYRYLYAIEVDGKGYVMVPINLSQSFSALNISGTFENSTMRLVEYSNTGSILKKNVSYIVEWQDDMVGELYWNVSGKRIRYYAWYFDVEENEGSRPRMNHSVTPGDQTGNVNWSSEPQGWICDLEEPIPDVPLGVGENVSIEVVTEAYASEVFVTIESNLSWDEIVYLNSSDNITWKGTCVLPEIANYSLTVYCGDEGGYLCEEVYDFQGIIYPDLVIVNISIPSEAVDELDDVEIIVKVKNNASGDATNYTIGLYMEQHSGNQMTFKNMVLSKVVSIDGDETKSIKFSWTATYGDDDEDGEWLVGAKAHYNLITYPDQNPLDNTLIADDRITVIAIERDPPVVSLSSISSEIELGTVVDITVTATDESGINRVELRIQGPKGAYVDTELSRDYRGKFPYEFGPVVDLGTYSILVTVYDDSLLYNVVNVSGEFTVINDSTAPSISYVGAFPDMQMIGEEIQFCCIVSDIGGIDSVSIDFVLPDGEERTYAMVEQTVGGSKYEWAGSFSEVGIVTFSISAIDLMGNSMKSQEYTARVISNTLDFDEDGMPNSWEDLYGFDVFDATDAEEDADNDGYTNLEEYGRGSDPLKENGWLEGGILILTDNWGYVLLSVVLALSVLVVVVSELRRARG